MTDPSRRSFNARMLGSLLTYGLIETLLSRDLLAFAKDLNLAAPPKPGRPSLLKETSHASRADRR